MESPEGPGAALWRPRAPGSSPSRCQNRPLQICGRDFSCFVTHDPSMGRPLCRSQGLLHCPPVAPLQLRWAGGCGIRHPPRLSPTPGTGHRDAVSAATRSHPGDTVRAHEYVGAHRPASRMAARGHFSGSWWSCPGAASV